jgi:hypothetical protein
MLMAGLTLALLGLVGLPASAGAQALRRAAAVVTMAGLALAGTAIGLVDAAHLGPHGVVIPALHDAANDRPISYTPVCGRAAGEPVCVNPADLTGLTAALAPVVRQWAGLPGAPVRAVQTPAVYNSTDGEGGQVMTISGRPPKLGIPLGALGISGAFGWTGGQVSDELRLLAEHAFVGAGDGRGTQAQQAVEAALLQGVGVPISQQPSLLSAAGLPSWGRPAPDMKHPDGPPPATSPVYDAARRLAALPSATRHAWLAAHLAALRSGQLTLAQLP